MTIPFHSWEAHVRRFASPVVADLAVSLAHLGRSIGERISDGEFYGVRQGEEGITESALLDLGQTNSQLHVRTLTHHRETSEGADWEWWVGNRRGGWFGYLVQAKKALPYNGSLAYDFGYTPAPTKKKPVRLSQIESLRTAARSLQLRAVYVLYNEANTGATYHQPISHHLVPPSSGGATVVSARAADRLLGIGGSVPVSVAKVAPFALPWSCLAYCNGALGTRHSSVPATRNSDGSWRLLTPLARNMFLRIQELEEAALIDQFDLQTLDPDPTESEDQDEPTQARTESELPEYVQRLLESDGDQGFEHPLAAEGLSPRRLAVLYEE